MGERGYYQSWRYKIGFYWRCCRDMILRPDWLFMRIFQPKRYAALAKAHNEVFMQMIMEQAFKQMREMHLNPRFFPPQSSSPPDANRTGESDD